jgi:hypothetical protein
MRTLGALRVYLQRATARAMPREPELTKLVDGGASPLSGRLNLHILEFKIWHSDAEKASQIQSWRSRRQMPSRKCPRFCNRSAAVNPHI